MVDKSLPRMIVSVLGPLLVLVGCSQQDVSGPPVAFTHDGPDPNGGHLVLCKTGPTGTFDIVNGDVASATLSDGECEVVATAPSAAGMIDVTITEQPLPPGVVLNQVTIEQFINDGRPFSSSTAAGPSVTVQMIVTDLFFVVTYENVPSGGEGCTPGFWKNHTSWPGGFDPSTSLFTDAGFCPPVSSRCWLFAG